LSHDECELDLKSFAENPIGYYFTKERQFPSYLVGGNYLVTCVDDTGKAELQKKYNLIRCNVENGEIPVMENFGFSSAPFEVKKITGLHIMSFLLHVERWNLYYLGMCSSDDWLRGLIITLDDQADRLIDSPVLQQSESNKHLYIKTAAWKPPSNNRKLDEVCGIGLILRLIRIIIANKHSHQIQ
jgi:hypothetical protein